MRTAHHAEQIANFKPQEYYTFLASDVSVIFQIRIEVLLVISILLNLSNVHPMYGRIPLKHPVYTLETRVRFMYINVYVHPV
jgi:hypothetical protein